MRPLTWFRFGLGSLALSLAPLACSQRTVTVQLRPLQASGEVTYVCWDGKQGVPNEECNSAAVKRGDRELFALLTQTVTGEVAVIDVPIAPTAAETGRWFVDQDPSTPGFGFLRVGARPGSIVTSPGGAASFVAVGEAGKPGIFALPTSCVGRPEPDAPRRDLTTWPACSLPTTPGEMRVLIDAPVPGAAGEPAVIYETCAHDVPQPSTDGEADQTGECPADLTREGGPAGRRKLVVTLPDRGSIAVIDAQWLLNQPQGSFNPCQMQEIPLKVELPVTPVAPTLPPDLANACSEALPSPPVPPAFAPRPSGLAATEDTLYVGDSSAPVVHVLDVSNVCAPRERAPLLPQSFERPDRVVTSSHLAVSPLTPTGNRFLYAVDEFDTGRSSVMAFDVSPGSTQRTPIIRPGSPYLPFESPDRLQFSAPVRDVTFIERDRPVVDPVTGSVTVGTACDPDPRAENSPGAAYRTNSDYTRGARARELRGVFAAILLTNGRVQVVDVEDYDAPCRRPVLATKAPDRFRGCEDAVDGDVYLQNGVRTVTDEVSCRMVEPHRLRAGTLGRATSEASTEAPVLRAWPNLKEAPGSDARSDTQNPKLLAVDFDNRTATVALSATQTRTISPGRAQVYVGTTLYDRDAPTNKLELDPTLSSHHSLVLPFYELRAYQPTEDLTLTYQGPLTGSVPTGFLNEEGPLVLNDSSFQFCDAGVYDVELMRELGTERFQLAGERLEAFAVEHADRLELRGDFPSENDSYWTWRTEAGEPISHQECLDFFGKHDADEIRDSRVFRVVDAEQQRLELEPYPNPDLQGDADSRERDRARMDDAPRMARLCFPSATAYTIRATKNWVLRSGVSFLHSIVGRSVRDAAGNTAIECRRDCNPRKKFFEFRVFEISAASECTNPNGCEVGYDPESPCQLPDVRPSGAMPFDVEKDAARFCIHDSPTARFALYRGSSASDQDMVFSWRTTGGFSSMRLDMTAVAGGVAPTSLTHVPFLDRLSVIDASTLGIVFMNLDGLLPITPTLN